jgi:hypothetical protein
MIHDLDQSLRTLLRREALNGADVEVVFDAPTKDWASRRNAPVLDVYLYDIREDLAWRAYGSVDLRGDDGRKVARQGPPRYFKLSYLVTAWTQRPEDEHRLLAAVLGCFLRFELLPSDVLTGALAGQRNKIPVTIALPPPQDRPLSDVWSALGGELKPSLDLVAVVPIDPHAPVAVGPLVLEDPKFNFDTGRGGEAVGGRTDRRRGGRLAPAAATVPAVQEVVEAGAVSHPGRILRVRATTEA